MSLNLGVVALFVVDFLVRTGQGHEELNGLATVISVVALALLGLA
jgi:hypothetical protein